MLRTLFKLAVGFVGGYMVGTILGFRVAVTDYVENDAGRIKTKAKKMYPFPEDDTTWDDEAIREFVEDVQGVTSGSDDESDDDDSEGTSAFY